MNPAAARASGGVLPDIQILHFPRHSVQTFGVTIYYSVIIITIHVAHYCYYDYLCLRLAEKFFFFSFVHEVVLCLLLSDSWTAAWDGLGVPLSEQEVTRPSKWPPRAQPSPSDSPALMCRAVRNLPPPTFSHIKDRTWTFDEDCSFAGDLFHNCISVLIVCEWISLAAGS